MAEKQRQYTLNDLYLIAEYRIRGCKSFFTTTIGDKTLIVPYKYQEKSKNPTEAEEKFKADLLDFQALEEKKYHDNGDVAFRVAIDGIAYVLPYDNQHIDIATLVKQVSQKALEKYNTAIEAHRRIKDDKPVEFSAAAVTKYTYHLAKSKDKASSDMEAILEFFGNCGRVGLISTGKVIRGTYKTSKTLAKIARNLSKRGYKKIKQKQPFQTFKTTGKKLFQDMFKKVMAEKKKRFPNGIPTAYKASMLALLLWGGGNFFVKQCTPDKRKSTIEKPQFETYKPEIPEGETQDTYIDFMGNVHADKYGNLKRMREIRPEIMTIILAIEGYAEHSFNDRKDGTGTETIGSGATILIDEYGNERAVKRGDITDPSQDVLNNIRYIDKKLIEVLGDSINRHLSDREICTIIGAGYCWGPTAIQTSSFLQSIKANESLTSKIRKLTGFRKQKGLLKRSALLAEYLSGNWKITDILDLPIYYVKNKGYVHCAIYTKDLSYYLPCEKDKNGKYKKDNNGNHIPIICKDDFCQLYYMDKDHKMLEGLKDVGFFKSYKMVREFLPTSYLNSLTSYSDYFKKTLNESVDDSFSSYMKSQR